MPLVVMVKDHTGIPRLCYLETPMGRYAGNKVKTRILCLGNDLIADDAFGIAAAAEFRKVVPGGVEVVDNPESGYHLMDYILGVEKLVVIAAVQTGKQPPGTVYRVSEEDMPLFAQGSPHYVGLFESIELARRLNLEVPKEIEVVAVETNDCQTLGAPMHPKVESAVDEVVGLVMKMIGPAAMVPTV